MPGDLIDALFQKAAEGYESARRWHFLLVLILLGFQGMSLVPYIDATRQDVTTRANIDRSTALQVAIGAVIADLGAFEKASVDAAEAEQARTLDLLVARFDALNDILEKLQKMTPEEAVGPSGEAMFCRAAQTPAQMQMAQMHLPAQTGSPDHMPGSAGNSSQQRLPETATLCSRPSRHMSKGQLSGRHSPSLKANGLNRCGRRYKSPGRLRMRA